MKEIWKWLLVAAGVVMSALALIYGRRTRSVEKVLERSLKAQEDAAERRVEAEVKRARAAKTTKEAAAAKARADAAHKKRMRLKRAREEKLLRIQEMTDDELAADFNRDLQR